MSSEHGYVTGRRGQPNRQIGAVIAMHYDEVALRRRRRLDDGI
jgi:hypothetical protein